MTIIGDIIKQLEHIAPPVYQENYDNAGLIVGDLQKACTGVITCLDSTEDVIDEAIAKGCNLVVAHHPIVFKGLKRFTGRNYVERVVMSAIKNDIAIYAIHTNLDNVYQHGVNAMIGERLGLTNTRILAPKPTLYSAQIHCSAHQRPTILNAITKVLPSTQTPPSNTETDIPISILSPLHLKRQISRIVSAHEGATIIFGSSTTNPLTGSGLVGDLPQPMPSHDFLRLLKKQLNVGCVKYTALTHDTISQVALCGGSGGFLLPQAISSGAQIFITADYKYHEFFDAEEQITIADIGHYESEQFTIDLLAKIIREKFGNFAVHLTEINTNPVNYL